MELANGTRMQAEFTLITDASGRDSVLVVVKGTFELPRTGEPVRLAAEQVPLQMADTFTGAPALSAPLRESDFAARKPACDVLLTGSAHAPAGRPASRVAVGLRVGAWQKSFAVTGDRTWQAGAGGISASRPAPFVKRPISYDGAFGGADVRHEDPAQHAWFERNPVGKGFHRHLRAQWIDGAPMPDTERLDQPVTAPDGDYEPMSFGPIGRGWQPRMGYAGTYDQRWLDVDFPFLPPDFDDRYHQSAPADQQIPLPVAGAGVVLVNLTPDGRRAFELPAFEAPVHAFLKDGVQRDLQAVLDTVCFEPDQERFTMTWRASLPLARDIFEVRQIVVGRRSPMWWQSRHQTTFPIPVLMVPMEPAETESATDGSAEDEAP